MPPAGFEPAIPAGDRLQTHALDRSASGIGILLHLKDDFKILSNLLDGLAPFALVVEKFSTFTRPEGLFLFSQHPIARFYSEEHESGPIL